MARSLVSLDRIEVGRLKGIGARRSEVLAKVGLKTVYDLICYYPRRYVDRTNQRKIAEIAIGEEAMLLGRVTRIATRRLKGGRVIVNAIFADSTGIVDLVFFNQPYRERQLQGADDVALFGKVENYRGRLQMTNPLVDLIGDRTGRIVPIYPQSASSGLLTRDVARFLAEALERIGEMEDPVPDQVVSRLGLLDRWSAYQKIHMPEQPKDSFSARSRLAFDELLRIQLLLVSEKVKREATAKGFSHDVAPFQIGNGTLAPDLIEALPFALTVSQRQVLSEIASDMSSPIPMHRLLQGDVGSGKTIVALVSMLFSVQGGHQSALLAPTTVLAEQHFQSISAQIRDLLNASASDRSWSLFGDDRKLKVELLTGSTPLALRRRILLELAGGEIDILIGTHALLGEGVTFSSLGLVVVDEQHRFGVEQRSLIKERERSNSGLEPDVLVMTATPIPRSAAMTVFGDLDISVVNELPPGRTRIETFWLRGESGAEQAWSEVKAEVARGGQAYVVCPLVDESERLEAASAVAKYEELSAGSLEGLRLGLVHGQMKPTEKASVMDRFRDAELDVLVATTVIEVGVDVPNAATIVILDADRFGIAQLHQLRGRVGRGSRASKCLLVSNSDDDSNSGERLKAMVESTDGFYLAERDLAIRGAGELMGTRQRGRTDLKLASLATDKELVESARRVAIELVGDDYKLTGYPKLVEELLHLVGEDEIANLFRG